MRCNTNGHPLRMTVIPSWKNRNAVMYVASLQVVNEWQMNSWRNSVKNWTTSAACCTLLRIGRFHNIFPTFRLVQTQPYAQQSTFLKKLFLTESTCSDESNSKLLDPRDRKPRVSRSRNQLDVPIVRGSSVLRKDLRLDLFIFPVLFVPKVKSINQIDL